MLIEYRKSSKEHVNLIHNSWMKSAFLSGVAASDLARIIPALLPHTHVAYSLVDGQESVLGWLCALDEPVPCVVYGYVKEPYRRLGVFTGLLAVAYPDHPGILQYCCHGGNLTKLLAQKYRAIYNPFFLVGRT